MICVTAAGNARGPVTFSSLHQPEKCLHSPLVDPKVGGGTRDVYPLCNRIL